MAGNRRNVRDMPYRRRHDGLNAADRSRLKDLCNLIVSTLGQAVQLPMGMLQFGLLLFVASLIAIVQSMYDYNWHPVVSVRHPLICNRGFNSFTEEEAYRDLRFHLNQLPGIMRYLRIPTIVTLPFQSPYNGKV